MELDHKIICQFRFVCTERWNDLVPVTGDGNKRFCSVCDSPVYLTTSYEELETNVAAKRCVAVFLQNPEGPPMEFMGDVVIPLPPSKAK